MQNLQKLLNPETPQCRQKSDLFSYLIKLLIFYFQVSGQQALSSNAIFAPIVTATCRAGLMTVKVETLDNFLGVVQSRDYRKPDCSGYGENSKITYLRVNMLAKSSDPEYCGVFINEVRLFSFCKHFHTKKYS